MNHGTLGIHGKRESRFSISVFSVSVVVAAFEVTGLTLRLARTLMLNRPCISLLA